MRFLDHWMRGRDNGVMKTPKLRAFVEDWSPPASWRDPAPGRWVGEAQWPSPSITPRVLHLSPSRLAEAAGEETLLRFRSPNYVGAGGGEWMGVGVPGEAPTDQRVDDGLSLCFDSEALTADLELLGAPGIALELASDQPIAQLCARLMALAPDGSSRRLSYGVLNLTHRDSHETPAALEPGRFYAVRLKLNDCGFRAPAGWRLRLALSTAYWPLIWPAPVAATLTLRMPGSTLTLPVRRAEEPEPIVQFDRPASGPRAKSTKIKPGRCSREMSLDLVGDIARYRFVGEGGVFGEGVLRLDETGTSLGHDIVRDYRIAGADPLSARYSVSQRYAMEWPGTAILIVSEVEMSATRTHFRLTGT